MVIPFRQNNNNKGNRRIKRPSKNIKTENIKDNNLNFGIVYKVHASGIMYGVLAYREKTENSNLRTYGMYVTNSRGKNCKNATTLLTLMPNYCV